MLDHVIAGVQPGQGVAAHGHRLVHAGVLVRKAADARARDRHAVAAQGSHGGRAAQGRAGGGVIGFIDGGDARYGQAGLVDGRRQAARLLDHVIAGVQPAQGVAAHGHRLVGAGVLVRKAAHARPRDRHAVAAQGSHGGRAAQGRAGGGIIGFIDGGDARYGQAGLVDARRQAARLLDHVVAGIQPGQGVAAHGHRLVGAGVLVRKAAHARARDRHAVAAQCRHGGRAAQGRAGGGIIGFIDGGDARYGQDCLADAGRQAARLLDHVIAGIQPAQGVAAHGHRLVGAGVLVRKAAHARARDRHAVAAQCRHGGRAAQGRAGGGVIGFIDGGDARYGQDGLVDGRRQPARLRHHIVARVCAGQGVATHAHRLVGAGVLVRKAAHARARDRHAVAAQGSHGGRAAQGHAGGSVIGFIDGGDARYGQAGLVDGRRQAARLLDHVIAGVQPGQGVAAHGHRLVHAGVLVRKAAHARARDRHAVAAQGSHGGRAAQGRAGGGIIGFIDGGDARYGQAGLVDARRQAARLRHHVIAGIQPGQGVAAHGHRLVHAGVLVRKAAHARPRDRHAVAAQCRHGGRATQGRAGGGVIGFIDGGDARYGQAGLVDARRQAARLLDHVIAGIQPGQGVATHADRLVDAGVLVRKAADARARYRHAVAAQGSHGGRAAQGRAGGGIIGFIDGGEARHGQAGLVDGRRQPARLRHHIVARVCAGQGVATHAHRLVGAGILVRKAARAAACQRDRVAANQARVRHVVGVERGRSSGVIGLVERADAGQRDAFGSDRIAAAGHANRIVIAGQAAVAAAAQAQARGAGKRRAALHVLAAQVRGVAGARDAELLPGHAGRRQRAARHRRGAVVGFAAGHDDISLVDGGAHRVWLHHVVIASVNASERIASHADRLVAAGIGVGKAAGAGANHRDAVAAQCAHGGRAAQGRAGGGIIGFIDGGEARYGQAGLVDGRRQAARLLDHVVAGVQPGQGVAAHGHRLVHAGVLVRKAARAAACQRDRVAANQARVRHVGGVERGRGGGVIGLVERADAGQRDAFGSDRIAAAGHANRVVVAGLAAVAAAAQAQARGAGKRRTALHVLAAQVRGVAGARDAELLPGHAGCRQRAARHRRRAIVGFGTGHDDIGLVDGSAHRVRLHHVVIAGINASERIAGHADRLVAAGIGVGKAAGAGANHRDAVAAQCAHGGRAAQCRAGGGVISFIGGRNARHDQAGLADAGRQAGWLRHHVIAGI